MRAIASPNRVLARRLCRRCPCCEGDHGRLRLRRITELTRLVRALAPGDTTAPVDRTRAYWAWEPDPSGRPGPAAGLRLARHAPRCGGHRRRPADGGTVATCCCTGTRRGRRIAFTDKELTHGCVESRLGVGERRSRKAFVLRPDGRRCHPFGRARVARHVRCRSYGTEPADRRLRAMSHPAQEGATDARCRHPSAKAWRQVRGGGPAAHLRGHDRRFGRGRVARWGTVRLRRDDADMEALRG
jgi:hypothetical protein